MKPLKLFFAGAMIICMLLGVNQTASAIPNLQIYIPGAAYDSATETWIINSYEYELWVIGSHLAVEDVKFAMAVPTGESGSIEIEWLTPSSSDYGSGTSSLTFRYPDADPNRMDYEAYQASYTSGPPDSGTYGFGLNSTPEMGDGASLPPHGVFPTDFYEYFIGNFGTNEQVQNYIPGDEWGDTAWGQTKKFYVNVSGYSWVDIVAYDHVVLGETKAKYVFSPFSHDGGEGSPVPEPATMLLVGTGLIGLAAVGKNKFKKSR